jgi:hypothetical protein
VFRSTLGHIPFHGGRNATCALIHVAVDFSKGSRLYALGSRGGVDGPDERIYCFEMGGTRIPFSVRQVGKAGWKRLADLSVRSWGYIPPEAGFSVLDLQVRDIATHPEDAPRGLRDSVSGLKVFSDEQRGMRFDPPIAERKHLILGIQEALPVLSFDHFNTTIRPDVFICGRVVVADPAYQALADESGRAHEGGLTQPPAEPMGPQEVLQQLQARNAKNTLTIEEALADVLDMERGFLYFGNLFTSTLVENEGFWDLLRDIYDARYTEQYDRFERFLLRVVSELRTRVEARKVHLQYSRPAA